MTGQSNFCIMLIDWLDSTIPIIAVPKMSRLSLVSVVGQAGLSLAWSHFSEDKFSHGVAYNMSHVRRKPVFGVCDQLRLKLACSADETS